MISFLLRSKEIKKKFIQPQNKEKLGTILIYFFQVYLPQNYDRTYEEVFEKCRFNSLRNIIDERLIKPMINYIQENETAAFEIDPQMIPNAIVERLQTAKAFTSIQVIHAAKNRVQFSKALQEGDLAQAVEVIAKESRKTELQMISQAVEHGSERSYVAATLMEAFQNSVDAIRDFVRKHPEVEAERTRILFDVRFVDPEYPRLLFKVADLIGMQSLKTLLADFLIINYSTKGEESESVGEMGNGSYQMYREAEMVTVQTRTLENPSKVYFLRIVPIRDPDTDEVVDLSHKCVDINDTLMARKFKGTELSILVRRKPETSHIALEVEGLGVRNFIQETFSVANPPLDEKHPLQCELKFPKGKKPLKEIQKEVVAFTLSLVPLPVIKCNMIRRLDLC